MTLLTLISTRIALTSLRSLRGPDFLLALARQAHAVALRRSRSAAALVPVREAVRLLVPFRSAAPLSSCSSAWGSNCLRRLYPDGFPCTVTGHPVLEEQRLYEPVYDRAKMCHDLGVRYLWLRFEFLLTIFFCFRDDTCLVGVFPGSRTQEVRRVVPDMLHAIMRLRREDPTIRTCLLSFGFAFIQISF